MKSDISLFSDDPKNSSICSFIEVVMAHKKWNDSFLSLFCSIKMISPRGLEEEKAVKISLIWLPSSRMTFQ